MRRTTISLPDELLKRLRVLAAERGISMAEIIREAVEERAGLHRPPLHSLGVGDSGTSDTAERSTRERPEPRAWR